jgi:hypothetical protein|tara:strand:+ start:6316 stop:7701 length:1386 start_codon:yes stop_codon:yes gene_type:complete
MSIKSFSDYIVESSREATFTFGRYNPPTIGHEVLFNKVKDIARGGKYRIYASQSVDQKKNPLEYKSKIKLLRKMFPKHARNIIEDTKVRNVFDVLVQMYDEGFQRATMVVGSDRVKEFEILINKYNGVKGRHGFYKLSFNVVSAGERDPDSDGAEGMSASKMRMAAQQNDLKLFSSGLPSNFKRTEDLFNAVRKGMGLSESKSFRKHIELPPVSETREEYVEGSLFKVGNLVKIKENNEEGRIVYCGSNYVMVESNNVRKRYWLDAIENIQEYNEIGTVKTLRKYLKMTPQNEKQDPDIKDRKGTQPKGYFAKDAEGKKMAKSTKAARDRHFKKGAKMDDDNPAAYKPAPGDARAKTKPSKHTKKFKQMYGEMAEYVTFEDFLITEQDADAALKKKADKSGMPLGILKQVFKRGVAAWRTGHRPGTNSVQWGLARVNSFVTKSSGTWGKADKDLAAKVRGK